MTFNIRADLWSDRLRRRGWARRRSSVLEMVRASDPDIIGFQEVRRAQLTDLVRAFPQHQAVGRPRDRSRAAESVPLFIHRHRFEIEESGDFWLSPTPEVEGSRGWDARYPRMCTWVRMRALEDGTRLVVSNTHFDHRGPQARIEAATLVAMRAVAHGWPAVIIGDLNAPPVSAPLVILAESGFRDALAAAHPDAAAVAAVRAHGDMPGARVDHILCDVAWQVLDATIVRNEGSNPPPSDHHAVVATLRAAR